MTFEEQLKTMRFHVIDGTTRLDEHGIRSILIAVRELVKEAEPKDYMWGMKLHQATIAEYKANLLASLEEK